MRTVSYVDFKNRFTSAIGVDTLLTAEETALKRSLNDRVRGAWTRSKWPELINIVTKTVSAVSSATLKADRAVQIDNASDLFDIYAVWDKVPWEDRTARQISYSLLGGYLVLPADTSETTVYVVGSKVPANDYGDSRTITNATNASPIIVTSASHGLSTGDVITIEGVVGNTNANAEWVITKIDANSFSLDDSTGNAGYTSGGTFTGSLPQFLERHLLAACIAAFYVADGQNDKAQLENATAEEYLMQEIDRVERLQQQNRIVINSYPALWPTVLISQTTV